jgi:hypothetical protein
MNLSAAFDNLYDLAVAIPPVSLAPGRASRGSVSLDGIRSNQV